jgi:hypothetical protein
MYTKNYPKTLTRMHHNKGMADRIAITIIIIITIK